MSNKKASSNLLDNFKHYWKLWRYAQARGLMFALKYKRKMESCMNALGWLHVPYGELQPITTTYAIWS